MFSYFVSFIAVGQYDNFLACLINCLYKWNAPALWMEMFTGALNKHALRVLFEICKDDLLKRNIQLDRITPL